MESEKFIIDDSIDFSSKKPVISFQNGAITDLPTIKIPAIKDKLIYLFP